MSRLFANGLWDQGSIPGRVILSAKNLVDWTENWFFSKEWFSPYKPDVILNLRWEGLHRYYWLFSDNYPPTIYLDDNLQAT